MPGARRNRPPCCQASPPSRLQRRQEDSGVGAALERVSADRRGRGATGRAVRQRLRRASKHPPAPAESDAERRGLGVPEMIHPAANGLVRDHNPTCRQQVFHVSKAKREPKIQPDRLLNDFRREAVAGIADFLHSFRYRATRPTASPKKRDNAGREPALRRSEVRSR
jgi:hypothetical protein